MRAGAGRGHRGAARAPRFLSAALAALLAAPGAGALPVDAAAAAAAPQVRWARAAILVDQASGRVLWERGADLPLPPASLAKLMTLHLVYQKLAERVIDREDVVWFGPDAYARHQPPGSSLMALEPGHIVTVAELMKGAAIQSGNDAAMALAEFVAGGVQTFTAWMNEESRLLGMRATTWADPAGVGPGSVTTARDLAAFCRAYVRLHPESLAELHSLAEFAYPQAHNLPGGAPPSELPEADLNHNWLVRGFGVDGLKTGRFDDENFTLALTAERGGLRLLAVLLGVPGGTLAEGSLRRSRDGLALLTWGFRTFRPVAVAAPDPGSLKVWKGASGEVPLVGPAVAMLAVRAEERERLAAALEVPPALVAPVLKGQKVGALVYRAGEGEVARYDLAAAADVAPGGLLRRAWDTVRMHLARLVRALGTARSRRR